MRLRLSLSLLAFVMAGISTAETTAPTATADLGNVMFVGDSITHGINGASWRYSFHKILVDAGVTYDAQGIKSGNYSNGVGTTTSYGGVLFNNVHSAEASARAWEIAGRQNTDVNPSMPSRFGGSSIMNWLGQETTQVNGTTYSGTTVTGANTPDTFFLLIGTNDLLSDNQGTLATNLDYRINTLLGDVDTIIGSMKTANSNAEIYLLTVPCWTTHTNAGTEAIHSAVASYNTALTSHYADTENVYVFDINKGIIDVANSLSFFGCSSMFNNPGTSASNDGLHPNAQGELLIAGNLAKAMGYAGRSVGLERRSNANLTTHFTKSNTAFTQTNVTVASGNKINFSATGNSSLSYEWATKPTSGYTVDFTATFGNGSTDGWETTTDLSISLGDGIRYGTLNINEAYIKWGSTIIYSTDMSANTDSLRIAYLLGDNTNNISSGYYVWLDDQLIGEALTATVGNTYNGLTISYSGTSTAVISNLSLDSTGAYAPTTTGYYNAADALRSSSTATDGKGMGTIDWKDSGFTSTATDLTASGTYNARNAADTSSGASGNSVGVEVTSGSCTKLFANTGNYTGDVWLTVSNGGSTASWGGGTGESGALTGNAYVRYTDTAAGGSTVFGAISSSITGNAYLEFSAETANFNSFTQTTNSDLTKRYSVMGTYSANISGTVSIVVNAGTFQGNIVGGSYTTGNTVGETKVYINGGTLKANVMGGGLAGTVGQAASGDQASTGSNVYVTGGYISGNVYGGTGTITYNSNTYTGTVAGDAAVTIYGGTIAGDIYGGGLAGAVNGNTSVTIYGGNISSNVYAGGTGGTIGGDSALTIDGSASDGGAHFINGASSIVFSAGGTGCTISGNTTVTLQNISSTDSHYGLDSFAGTISGGGTEVSGDTKTFNLDNVQVALKATIDNFTDVNLDKATHTTLTSLGGAPNLSIDGNSALTLTGGLATLKKVTLTPGSSLAIKVGDKGAVNDGNIAGVLSLDNGAELTLSDSATLDSAEVTIGDSSKLVLTDSEDSDYTVTVLAGTGTLDNNSTLTINSDDDATFAGTLAGTGTIDLKGEGTQTFVGAGCSGQTVNVNEGNLVLTPGTADAIALRSLTAKKGTTVTIAAAGSNTSAKPVLNLSDDLNLEGSNLVLALNSNIEDYSSTPMISVTNGDINMDNTTITLGAPSAGDPENLGTFKVTLAAVKQSTAADATTGTDTTTGTTDPTVGNDTANDGTATPDAAAGTAGNGLRTRAVRLADTAADDPEVSADGASVETSGSYAFYYTNVAVTTTDSEVILSGTLRSDNPFSSSSTTPNATAGSNLIWNTLTSTPTSSTLGQARNAIREAIQSGDKAQAAKIMAGVAGSTLNATGTAQRDALQSQLGWIRNRTTLMGVNSDYSYDDLPYVHMWIEGTGATAKLNSDGDEGE
jgi:lysophospholipase L1-like esterase